MRCQLMVGFFAIAKSLEIHVDKQELEDALWHSREDIKRALVFKEYEKAQRTNAFKVNQICKGAEKGQSLSPDLTVESGEPVPMFFPGPFAIADLRGLSKEHQGCLVLSQICKPGAWTLFSIFIRWKVIELDTWRHMNHVLRFLRS